MYGRKPESLSEILQGHEQDKMDGRKLPPKEYKEFLDKRQKMIEQALLDKKLQAQLHSFWKQQRMFPETESYKPGDLVMVKNPLKSEFFDGKVAEGNAQRKFMRPWVGPVPVALILDQSKMLLQNWDGKIIKQEFHKNQVKHFRLREGFDQKEFRENITEAQKLLAEIQKMQLEAKPANQDGAHL